MRGQRFADHARDDVDVYEVADLPGSELVPCTPLVVERRGGSLAFSRSRLTTADVDGQRARRLPYLATAATYAVGSGAWGAAELAALAGQPALSGGIVVGTWLASGASAGALGLWFRNRIPDAWRRTYWMSLLGAAAGVDLVASAGPWPALAAVATAGAAIASGSGWMAAHALPTVPPPPRPVLKPVPRPRPLPVAPPPPPPPPPIPVDPRHPLHIRWDERVAAGDKVVLKAAELIPLDLTRETAKWKIDTNGDYTFDEIAATHRKIAARLLILARNVLIERDGEEEGSALLTIVLIDTVLTKDLTYPGPNYDNGEIKVALAADGASWLTHIADDPEKGCQSGMVVGEPGSGKTAALETIVAGMRHSGVWDVLYADGDPGGGSSHVLNKIVHHPFAGPMGALRVLEAMEAVIEYRTRLKPWLVINLRTGLIERIPEGSPIPDGCEPVRDMHATHQYHGVLGVIDEFKRHLSDDRLKAVNFAERVENVEAIGRKYGVRWLIGTQSLLAGHWGLRTNLRAWLASRNAWILRSQNQSEDNVLAAVDDAASSLPEIPGSCYGAGGGRMVRARFAWDKRIAQYAAQFPTDPTDRGTAMAIAVALAGPPRPAAAAGQNPEPEAPQQSLEDVEAALAAGKNPFIPEPEKKDDKAAGEKQVKPQPAADAKPAQPRPWRTPSGAGIPAPLTGATVTQLHPKPTPTPPALTAKAEQVRAWLWANPGPHTTGYIADELGMPLSTASKALGVLYARGEATRPNGVTGTYAGVQPARTSTAT